MPVSAGAAVHLPPFGADFDYQLGGAAPAPAHVRIVVRDRRAHSTHRRYDICYVNAFQTQPDETGFWRKHRALILRHQGHPVVDSAWGERLVDIGTRDKRQRLARIVGGWVHGCARHGFDAVEFDNLDSFTRSHHLLTAQDARRFARLLVRRAHAEGLAAAQKNWAGFDGRRVGYDFAIAEECGRWRECGRYVAHYGRRVLVVEYRARDFTRTCRRWPKLSVELRDLALRAHGVHRWC